MTSNCSESIRHSVVTVKEKGRKARFLNPNKSKFVRTKVDNCLITEGNKADYIISKVGVGSVIVELKGSDVDHACKQLFATAINKDAKKILEGKLGFLIVCSKYPRFDSFVAIAKNAAAQKFKAGLKIVCDERDLIIEEIIQITE